MSLVISVEDIIPDSGIAVVGYIFGYKQKQLIQVNIVWGAENMASTTPENLVATGNILRNYFVEQSFPQEGLILNERLEDGSVLMFRGIDAKGRVALVQLTLVQAAGDEGAGPAQDVSLRLSYIVDPNKPDVFKLDTGAF